MPLPSSLLPALPPRLRDERPWYTLFSTETPHVIFDRWRQGFGGHPEPPASELLAFYLPRHVNRFTPRLPLHSHPILRWPSSPDGPWPPSDGGNPASSVYVEAEAPVGVLIALGADPTIRTQTQHDVLGVALENRWSGVVRQILAHPQCPPATELMARLAPAIAEYGLPSLPWSHVLALTGRHEELTDWLGRPGMDPDQRDAEGRTPLFYATKTAAVNALVAAGANPHAVDRSGRSIQQTWLRPAKSMEAVIKRTGVAPLAEREACLANAAPREPCPGNDAQAEKQQKALLFDKLGQANAAALTLARSLTPEEAETRLEKNLPGFPEPVRWGPVAHAVVTNLNERANEAHSANSRRAMEDSRLLDWATGLLHPDTPEAVRKWLDHETCPGVPDRILVSLLAHTLPHYRFKWRHSPEEASADVTWKALHFLTHVTTDDGRRAVLTHLNETFLKAAWASKHPEPDRIVAFERLVSLWSKQAGRGFFNAVLKERLSQKTTLLDPETEALMVRKPELASAFLLCLAAAPDGEHEALRWLEKGVRPLPGKPTERLVGLWKSKPAVSAIANALLIGMTVGESSPSAPRKRVRM